MLWGDNRAAVDTGPWQDECLSRWAPALVLQVWVLPEGDAAAVGAAEGAAGAGVFTLVVSWQGEGDRPHQGSHARPVPLGCSKTPQLSVEACQLDHRSTG